MRSQSGVTFRELSVEHQVQGGDVGRCFFLLAWKLLLVVAQHIVLVFYYS